jgi:soluble lytic murein transglycosylase-like protein
MLPSETLEPTFVEAAKAFVWRQIRLCLGLGLLTLLAINFGVRECGGSVHLLSVSRVRERARALSLYALHGLTCSCHDHEVTIALRAAAARHGVPYRLALSVARTESSLQHMVVSGTGAMGVMQLMPDTARELGVSDPFSVEQNVDGGVRYLKTLLTAYHGNVRRALAAYNAGPGRIPRRGPLTMPDQTRTYVARILAGM